MSVHPFARLLALALLVPASAAALDLRVGTGAGCTHATLQAALDALEAQAGLHTVRINKGGYAVADGMVYVPTVNQTGVFVEGGYDSCTAPAPTGDVTVDADRAVFNGAGGAPRAVLDLRLFGRVGTFQIRRVVLTGGDATTLSSTTDEFESGGGLIVRGGASVLLGLGTSVRGNAAINGGGIALAGSRVVDTASIARIDLFIDEGAEVTSNTATTRGGGIYCGGGNPAPDMGPDGNRHGSIVMRQGTIAFNQAEQGGAFYCRGSLQGGGGLQPAPRDGAAAWILGNQGGAGGLGCAAGDATLDAGITPGPDGRRTLGAPDGGTGILAITSNTAGGSPGLCLLGSPNLGTTTVTPGSSRFRIQNIYVSDQSGGGTLGVLATAGIEVDLRPSGDNVACSFFSATPCVRFVGNAVATSGGITSNGLLLSATNGAVLNVYRGLIDGNRGRTRLFSAATDAVLRLWSSIVDDNTVVVGTAQPVDSAALFEATLGGTAGVYQTTVVMRSPLDFFFRIGDGVDNGFASAHGSILASTAAVAPANVGGLGPASRLTREWCGFFQSTADFASHTVANDPTTATFVVLPPAAFSLAAGTYAPLSAGLIDACSAPSYNRDFHGRPFDVQLEPGGAVRADIGAVEAQPVALPDPLFANGFEDP
jgi:predicted outer membrane repeat protein